MHLLSDNLVPGRTRLRACFAVLSARGAEPETRCPVAGHSAHYHDAELLLVTAYESGLDFCE